ncbi:hypothetical protein MCP_1568 [Methanocella paludicola SANAE]|uniref:Uncharacterized protein n=2 Tax=Methanocella TaxID=570266 RepID=D1YYW8_METPS|nr:hypothetical protein MCP_1568 [Methanocella paludicola SANAE]
MAGIAVADNGITVIKPAASAGQYGTGAGQIDTPVSVRVDAGDNVYILQHVHTSGPKFKSVITIYDKNLTLVRSFDVLKKSMVDVGWDRASNGYYYDNLASAFDIDGDGNLFILCGWDVVVYSKDGKYQYQFPVSAFMGWIDNTGNETQFYYPRGLAISSDDYVVITSGSTRDRHEVIFIYPEGKIYKKLDVQVSDMADIVSDGNGSFYIVEAGRSVIHSYDSALKTKRDIRLDFNGTYNGSPASLAFMPDGNMTASANGIFVYALNGSIQAHFMDNNLSENDRSWNRLVAANSTGWLIMVSGMEDKAKTPKPVNVYRFYDGAVVGEPEQADVCSTFLAMFGAAAALYFSVRRF